MRRLFAALPLVSALLLSSCSQADLPPWAGGTKSAPQTKADPAPVQAQRPQVQLPKSTVPEVAPQRPAAVLAVPVPPPGTVRSEPLAPAPQSGIGTPPGYEQLPGLAALPSQVPPVLAPPGQSFQGRDEIRAALLLPLSGPYAAWGQAMSNAAQLALFDVADPRLNLIPLDTKGTPEGAQAALAQAHTQGADIVLGPVFSPEVKAVAAQARAWNLPLVSFTTDRTVLGQGVYTLGFLPESQVRRIVGHAKSQGKDRFALLARSDEYGQAVAEAFRLVVPQLGGQVVKVEFYDPQAKDLSPLVRKFTESDSRTRGRDKKDASPVPPPPFDAVMIADEGTRLRTVSSLVTYFEVDTDKVPLLGTMLWDDPRLTAEPSLQGALFAAPATDSYADFERRYAAAFGARPPRAGTLRASMAYDATALAATLVRQNLDFGQTTLTNSAGFAGMDGLFRLRADGAADRGLAVREIVKTGIRDVAPSPTSFVQPGM